MMETPSQRSSRATMYQSAVLTLIAVLLLAGTFGDGVPGPRQASATETVSDGLPNPADQRNDMIRELRTIRAKVEKIEASMERSTR